MILELNVLVLFAHVVSTSEFEHSIFCHVEEVLVGENLVKLDALLLKRDDEFLGMAPALSRRTRPHLFSDLLPITPVFL